MNRRTLFESRLFPAMLVILVIAAVGVTFRDPFLFDDRPHIERLMRLALSNAQADTTVDMEERMWAQVKLGLAANLSDMSEHEWGAMSHWFLARNPGYVGLQLLAQIDAVFVTVEPNGASHKPSGKSLLFAYLRIDPNHP